MRLSWCLAGGVSVTARRPSYEREQYRPDDREDLSERTERLLLERNQAHNAAPDLYAFCSEGCGQRFDGDLKSLLTQIKEHKKVYHGDG